MLWTKIQKLIKDLDANSELLHSCEKPHNFVEETYTEKLPQKGGTFKPETFIRYKCSKCKGLVDIGDERWYREGLKDGRKNE